MRSWHHLAGCLSQMRLRQWWVVWAPYDWCRNQDVLRSPSMKLFSSLLCSSSLSRFDHGQALEPIPQHVAVCNCGTWQSHGQNSEDAEIQWGGQKIAGLFGIRKPWRFIIDGRTINPEWPLEGFIQSSDDMAWIRSRFTCFWACMEVDQWNFCPATKQWMQAIFPILRNFKLRISVQLSASFSRRWLMRRGRGSDVIFLLSWNSRHVSMMDFCDQWRVPEFAELRPLPQGNWFGKDFGLLRLDCGLQICSGLWTDHRIHHVCEETLGISGVYGISQGSAQIISPLFGLTASNPKQGQRGLDQAQTLECGGLPWFFGTGINLCRIWLTHGTRPHQFSVIPFQSVWWGQVGTWIRIFHYAILHAVILKATRWPPSVLLWDCMVNHVRSWSNGTTLPFFCSVRALTSKSVHVLWMDWSRERAMQLLGWFSHRKWVLGNGKGSHIWPAQWMWNLPTVLWSDRRHSESCRASLQVQIDFMPMTFRLMLWFCKKDLYGMQTSRTVFNHTRCLRILQVLSSWAMLMQSHGSQHRKSCQRTNLPLRLLDSAARNPVHVRKFRFQSPIMVIRSSFKHVCTIWWQGRFACNVSIKMKFLPRTLRWCASQRSRKSSPMKIGRDCSEHPWEWCCKSCILIKVMSLFWRHCGANLFLQVANDQNQNMQQQFSSTAESIRISCGQHWNFLGHVASTLHLRMGTTEFPVIFALCGFSKVQRRLQSVSPSVATIWDWSEAPEAVCTTGVFVLKRLILQHFLAFWGQRIRYPIWSQRIFISKCSQCQWVPHPKKCRNGLTPTYGRWNQWKHWQVMHGCVQLSASFLRLSGGQRSQPSRKIQTPIEEIQCRTGGLTWKDRQGIDFHKGNSLEDGEIDSGSRCATTAVQWPLQDRICHNPSGYCQYVPGLLAKILGWTWSRNEQPVCRVQGAVGSKNKEFASTKAGRAGWCQSVTMGLSAMLATFADGGYVVQFTWLVLFKSISLSGLQWSGIWHRHFALFSPILCTICLSLYKLRQAWQAMAAYRCLWDFCLMLLLSLVFFQPGPHICTLVSLRLVLVRLQTQDHLHAIQVR